MTNSPDREYNLKGDTHMIDDMLYTVKDVISYLKVSRATIYRFMLRGTLQVHRVGRGLRFYGADVKACCRKDTQQDTTLAS